MHNAKKLPCFIFFVFSQLFKCYISPTGLTENIILNTVMGTLLTIRYRFSWLWVCHFISATKVHY